MIMRSGLIRKFDLRKGRFLSRNLNVRQNQLSLSFIDIHLLTENARLLSQQGTPRSVIIRVR